MLYSPLQLSLVAQWPWAQAGQLLLVAGIIFAAITLVVSISRFHRMLQLGDQVPGTAEERNHFFLIQVRRHLSKITRGSPAFGLLIAQFIRKENEQSDVQAALLQAFKSVVRNATDKAYLFRDDGIAAILDTEEKNVPTVTRRIFEAISKRSVFVPGLSAIRAGVSSVPMHGRSAQAVIAAASDALETVHFEQPLPFCLAPPLDELHEKEDPVVLDPSLAVLKSGVVGSYMRKYLSELRQAQRPAALLCVGINRMEQIIALHGEADADELIIGVSRILQRLTRDCDLIGHYHRDDFLILAPCTLPQSEKIAARLREAVQKETFLCGNKRLKTTISMGITAYPEHGHAFRDLFNGAYRAREVVRDWNAAAGLVYDPAQHGKKSEHESRC